MKVALELLVMSSLGINLRIRQKIVDKTINKSNKTFKEEGKLEKS